MGHFRLRQRSVRVRQRLIGQVLGHDLTAQRVVLRGLLRLLQRLLLAAYILQCDLNARQVHGSTLKTLHLPQ